MGMTKKSASLNTLTSPTSNWLPVIFTSLTSSSSESLFSLVGSGEQLQDDL